MAFNYAKEKQQFDREWVKKEKEYTAAGMLNKNIQTMKDFDWAWFCSRRKFAKHTQSLPSEVIDKDVDSDELTTLFSKFKSLSVDITPFTVGGRYGWVEEIDDEQLTKKLKKLSEDDLDLLTLIVFDGYTQTEVAKKYGIAQKNICKKIKRIKVFLK